MKSPDALIQWLLESDEPWTRYRTRVDLLDCSEDDPEVKSARREMLAHPQVCALIQETASWGDRAFERHNDAKYPIYKFSILADFGVRVTDRGMGASLKRVMSHRAPEGAFQSWVNIPKSFGGTGEDAWTWMVCDSPTLLYVLLAMGVGEDKRVKQAANHLAGLVQDNGWHCTVAPELGKFRGPGRKTDPCPIANVYALKALALVPELFDSRATRAATEMLLQHWKNRAKEKPYLFGIGTDFCKLKYPFVWYDILHVVEVLSRFSFVHADRRFQQMVETITAQADAEGRYTASSMYQSWKGWSFADKKNPSPWLTFLVLRMLKRVGKKIA